MNGMKVVIGGQGAGMFSILRGAVIGAKKAEDAGLLPVFHWVKSAYDDNCPNLWPLLFQQHTVEAVVAEVSIEGHPDIPSNDSYWHNRTMAYPLTRHIVPLHPIPLLYPACRVAIHYRATDKANECTLHPLQVYLDTAARLSCDLPASPLFVASDAQDCVEEIREFFSRRHTQVVCHSHMRSPDRNTRQGLHYRGDGQIRIIQAREAISDAWTLSQSDYLVSNVSNLSYWSTYLNPQQTHIVIR